MSSLQERNIAVSHARAEAFNRHDEEGVLSCFDKDIVNFGRRVGHAGIRMVHQDIWTRFPDASLVSKETVAVGDCVIERGIYSGTHLGVGRLPVDGGLLIGVPPTGKRFAVQHIHWWTLKNGLIVEHRANRDDMSMMMQLGLLPAIPLVAEPANVYEAPVEHRNVTGTAEQERNIAVIRAQQEAFVRRDLDCVVSYFADDAHNHGRAGGPERFRMVFGNIFKTYEQLGDDTGIKDIVAVDDCVIARFERTLRHIGAPDIPIDGGLLMGVPPTNKTFTQRHIHWWTLKDGLITSHRACRDDVGMMVELGLLPAPPSFPVQ
jgi:predicted ester cyclase